MSELEEAWEFALAEAHKKAQNAGRTDIAEYLRLRASNDLSRKAGIDWLLNTFEKLAGDANRAGSSLQIAREDSYRFPVGTATMVGPRMVLSLGVRSISIEAGWPRVPSDRFVKGGGLAHGRIRHFGRKAHDEDLLLLRTGDQPPGWISLKQTGEREHFRESCVQRHLAKLISDVYR